MIEDLLIVNRVVAAAGTLEMREYDFVIYVRNGSATAAEIRQHALNYGVSSSSDQI